MTKKNPEMFRAVCDSLITDPKMQNAAARAGITVPTLWRWLAASTDNPEAYLFDYGEFGKVPLHQGVKIAKQIALAMVEESLTAAAFGFNRKQYFAGAPVWKVDPKLAADAQDPELWMMLYGERPITDIYSRNERGELIHDSAREKPDTVAAIALLRARNPRTWGEHKSVEISHSTGVKRIGGENARLITQQAVETEAREIAVEPSCLPADLSDDPPEMVGAQREPLNEIPEAGTMVTGPEDTDPPEHVTRKYPDMHQPLAEPSTDSDLRRDLMRRLAAGVKNPRPLGPVDLGVGVRNQAAQPTREDQR